MTTVRTDQAARGYWTTGRGNSERAFRAARRHSRVVRFLRVAVPVAVVLGIFGIFLATYLNPLRMLAKLPVDVGNLVVSGTQITMEKPHLSGFTRDERAYELFADAAKQDMTKPDVIELRNLRAKVQMQDKSTIVMSADTGIYDSKRETLKVEQHIVLNSSAGYRGQLSEAMVDIHKGYVVSEHPVVLDLLKGTLKANRLEIVDSGDLVRFGGGVNMTLMLGDASQAKTEAR
ncbi:MAG: LPS export ABC transporter periplasmic protein LptC [Pseudolabrys sp.]